jgi:hypothetical protein
LRLSGGALVVGKKLLPENLLFLKYNLILFSEGVIHMQTGSTYKTNTMAIISLVAGILSWVMFPMLAAIVAIITGHMARTQIKESLGTETGDILAIIGLILGYLNIILSCLGLVFALLIFGGVFGLTGCAVLSEAASYIPADIVIPPIPAG